MVWNQPFLNQLHEKKPNRVDFFSKLGGEGYGSGKFFGKLKNSCSNNFLKKPTSKVYPVKKIFRTLD